LEVMNIFGINTKNYECLIKTYDGTIIS